MILITIYNNIITIHNSWLSQSQYVFLRTCYGLHSADLANVLWLYLSLHYYVVLVNWLTESGFKKWADHGDSRT